ncbi:MAG: hypothetical protein NVS4B3_21260 [Gemmatimonadaceae bacterium]
MWDLMIHGVAFLSYDRQYGIRGDDQFGSMNWGMFMATRPLGIGQLQLRGMMSLEPWTVTARGYPLLLQSGESYSGLPLHDRQHPHDLFMELAASYERTIRQDFGLSLYAAAVGEPASGPVAFSHRPSAAANPLAPLGHHWQDATHISFGVLTAGLFTRHLRIEGSFFNGREPDENRTNFDFRTLDSYAGRITVNPSVSWSASASFAYLASPETLAPTESQHRATASLLYGRPVGRDGSLSAALIVGTNKHSGDSKPSKSALFESTYEMDRVATIFGRGEVVQKTAADLGIALVGPERVFEISSLTVGGMREVGTFSGGSIGLGGLASLGFVPAGLVASYGTGAPVGAAIFLRFRPHSMDMTHGTISPLHHAPASPR